jgi:hypothetical protein
LKKQRLGMNKLRWWQFKKKKRDRILKEELDYSLHKKEIEEIMERIKNGKKEGLFRKIRSGEKPEQ